MWDAFLSHFDGHPVTCGNALPALSAERKGRARQVFAFFFVSVMSAFTMFLCCGGVLSPMFGNRAGARLHCHIRLRLPLATTQSGSSLCLRTSSFATPLCGCHVDAGAAWSVVSLA